MLLEEPTRVGEFGKSEGRSEAGSASQSGIPAQTDPYPKCSGHAPKMLKLVLLALDILGDLSGLEPSKRGGSFKRCMDLVNSLSVSFPAQ